MHANAVMSYLPSYARLLWYSAVDGPSVRVKDQYITCILEQPTRRNDLAKAHSAASTFAVSDNETSTNRQTTIVITSDCLQNCTRPETRFEPTKTFTGEGTMCVCVGVLDVPGFVCSSPWAIASCFYVPLHVPIFRRDRCQLTWLTFRTQSV